MHGAPVHVGDPAALGIADLAAPDYGDAVEIRAGEVPVFWACGVTPQAVAAASRPELMITHAPGHMFVSDRRDPALDQRERPHRRAGAAAQLQRQADERELAHAVARQLLEVERLDDVDARRGRSGCVWPGSVPSSGSTLAGTSHARLSAPTASGGARRASARPSAVDPARGLVGRPVVPQRARAEPDEHHVAAAAAPRPRRPPRAPRRRRRAAEPLDPSAPARRAARRARPAARSCRRRAR